MRKWPKPSLDNSRKSLHQRPCFYGVYQHPDIFPEEQQRGVQTVFYYRDYTWNSALDWWVDPVTTRPCSQGLWKGVYIYCSRARWNNYQGENCISGFHSIKCSYTRLLLFRKRLCYNMQAMGQAGWVVQFQTILPSYFHVRRFSGLIVTHHL